MDWKKKSRRFLAAGLAAASLMAPTAFAAEKEEPVIEAGPPSAEQEEMTSEELLQSYIDSGQKYTSQRYGYSIVCPRKPTVVPLSVLFDDSSQKGEVLIFKSTGYDIGYGWIIMVDAFDEATIPPDITKSPEAEQKAFIDKFMEHSSYEFVRLTEVDGRSGVYAVTAKEIEVDTNGDGKMDEVLTAESQMIRTFFRGAYGGRFGIMLMDNPSLTREGVALYQLGILTFQEWPTSMQNGQNVEKQDKKDKKEKQDKEKKDNKTKKDKK